MDSYIQNHFAGALAYKWDNKANVNNLNSDARKVAPGFDSRPFKLVSLQGTDPMSEVVHGPLGRGHPTGPHPGGHEGNGHAHLLPLAANRGDSRGLCGAHNKNLFL